VLLAAGNIEGMAGTRKNDGTANIRVKRENTKIETEKAKEMTEITEIVIRETAEITTETRRKKEIAIEKMTGIVRVKKTKA
jgi:hypothetical protein